MADRLAAFPGAVEPICIMFPLISDMGRTGGPASVKILLVVLTLGIQMESSLLALNGLANPVNQAPFKLRVF